MMIYIQHYEIAYYITTTIKLQKQSPQFLSNCNVGDRFHDSIKSGHKKPKWKFHNNYRPLP